MKYIGHICLVTCMFCALICSCHSIPNWKRSKLNLDPCPEACKIMLEVQWKKTPLLTMTTCGTCSVCCS